MKIRFSVFLVFVLMTGTGSCAEPSSSEISNVTGPNSIAGTKVLHHQYDPSDGQTYVLGDYSVFVSKEKTADTLVSATLFYNGAIEKETLVNKMLWILEATNAPLEFRNWAKKNLAKNRRFAQDNFVMPLRGFNQDIHEFSYTDTEINQLYILSYRRLKYGR